MPSRPPVHRPAHWNPEASRQAQLAALDKRRGSSSARGYGSDWQKVRLLALDREPLCRFCAAKGRVTPATEVDHIKPVTLRPDLRLELSNLRPLCQSCHSALTASGVQRR